MLYVNNPCSKEIKGVWFIASYCITGVYASGGGGVLAWCYSLTEAKEALEYLKDFPNIFDISSLRIEKTA